MITDNKAADFVVIFSSCLQHRISSLQLCDRVLLIEDGKLVMDDTPDAVLKQIPVDD